MRWVAVNYPMIAGGPSIYLTNHLDSIPRCALAFWYKDRDNAGSPGHQGRPGPEAVCRAALPSPARTWEDVMTKKFALGVFAATALPAAPGTAAAEDKVLAIVVKGLDNPFFEQIHLGCEKANKELAGSGYTCLYTGRASSADEA